MKTLKAILVAMLLMPLTLNASDKTTTKKTCSETFIIDDNTEWENVGKGIKRKVLGYDGQLMVVKIKFEKGSVGTPHTHYHTQATYIVSGKFEFTINGEKKIVKAGDGLYMAPDVMHGCVCLEPGILVDCFSPMRADFIGKK